jgi:hypothetical protein
MERSYARGVRYGYDRARGRGLWRVQIQEYLIGAVQNLQVLLKYGFRLKGSPSVMIEEVKGVVTRTMRFIPDFKNLIINEMDQVIPAGFIYSWLSKVEN